jgi:hypothetical protein
MSGHYGEGGLIKKYLMPKKSLEIIPLHFETKKGDT